MSVFYSFLHHPGFFCYMAKDNCKRRTGNVDEKEVGSREKKMNSPVLLARGSQCPPPLIGIYPKICMEVRPVVENRGIGTDTGFNYRTENAGTIHFITS
jgi:hypothetical protein